MAKSVLDIVIRTYKEGGGEKETVKGLVSLKNTVTSAVGAFSALAGAGIAVYQGIKQATEAFTGYAAQVRELNRLTGAGAEETSRLIQMADDAAISYESLQKSLWNASKNGVEVNIESIARLADEYVSLESPTERARLLAETFGKSGAEMGKLLEKGGEGVRSMSAAIGDSLILTEAQIAQAELYRIQIDNLTDAWEGFKVQAGASLVGVLTGSTAAIQKQAQELFKQQYGFNINTNLLHRYTEEQIAAWEAAKKLATEQWMVANGLGAVSESAQDAAQELGAAAEKTSEVSTANQNMLSLIGQLQSAYDSYIEKNESLRQKLDELYAQQEKLPPWSKKYEDLQAKIDETTAAIEENAIAHEEANKKIAFSLLQQKASMDGLTDAEFKGLLKIGTQWGIFDEKVAESAMLMDMNMQLMANSLSDPQSRLNDMTSKIKNLINLQDRPIILTFILNTLGKIPSVPGGGERWGGSIGPLDDRAGGGPLGNNWTIVGEEGYELITPSGYVIPHEVSRAILSSGFNPEKRMAFGGDLDYYTYTPKPLSQTVTRTSTTRKGSIDSRISAREFGGTAVTGTSAATTGSFVEDVITPMAETTANAVSTMQSAQQQASVIANQTMEILASGTQSMLEEQRETNRLLRMQQTTITRAIVSGIQMGMP